MDQKTCPLLSSLDIIIVIGIIDYAGLELPKVSWK